MANSIEKIIKIKVDTKQAEADLRKLKGDINNNDNVTIKVDIDTTDAVSGLQEIQGELEGLQDIEVSASIDATTESMGSMTVAAGEYNEAITKSTEETNNYSSASSVNTAANIVQLRATGQLTDALKGKTIATAASVKFTKLSILHKQEELVLLQEGTDSYAEVRDELDLLNIKYSKYEDELKAAVEVDREVIKLSKEVREAYKDVGEELDDYNEIIDDNTDAKNDNSDSSESFIDGIEGETSALLNGIPIIGKYASKLSGAATAGVAFIAYLGSIAYGIRNVNDAVSEFIDGIKAGYSAGIGQIQAGLTWLFGGFDGAVYKSTIAVMNDALDKLGILYRRRRELESEYILDIAEANIKKEELRTEANDRMSNSVEDRYKLAKKYEQAIRDEYKLKLEWEQLALDILIEEANLNGTLEEDEVEINTQKARILGIKAQLQAELRNVARLGLQITKEFNANIKKNKPKAGKPEKEYYNVDVGATGSLDLVSLEQGEVQVYELKKKYAEKTADMLNRHAEMVKEMDKQVLINKIYLASEYAGVSANLANAVAGYYDQEIASLEAKGITEGKEYEKAIKRREQAAIAGVIMSTGSAIMSTWASYMESPGGAPGAILAGIQTAALLVTAATQINSIKNAKSGAISSGGAGASPTYNVIAENDYNPIDKYFGGDSNIGNKMAPIKAYVVSKDVTTQQELDRQTATNSSIG